ncbi:hypothetical protein HMPREF9418_2867 [Neisseria macacae ATCC 33926]|uniref:Uncharacterized protein n=1 Tax=Neisseria macacae ATCC 33926 TaxID=997348 RepID=A0AA36UFZ7_9NEIS|nr:hypothetical protein HMPREF9418_2867 [Neisseria macacae ATCC 33926]
MHVAGIQQVKNIAQHCLPILVKIDDLIGACLFFLRGSSSVSLSNKEGSSWFLNCDMIDCDSRRMDKV